MLAQALYAAELLGQEEAQGAVDAYAEASPMHYDKICHYNVFIRLHARS